MQRWYNYKAVFLETTTIRIFIIRVRSVNTLGVFLVKMKNMIVPVECFFSVNIYS